MASVEGGFHGHRGGVHKPLRICGGKIADLLGFLKPELGVRNLIDTVAQFIFSFIFLDTMVLFGLPIATEQFLLSSLKGAYTQFQ
jgi:hypothetical protein